MASKRQVRRKQCEGKRGYTLRKDALTHAYRLKKKDGTFMRVYHCGFCGKYHVGHPRRH